MINKVIFISILLCFSIVSLISAQEIKTKNYFDDLSIKERKVIVEKGTEQAWTGEYNKFFEKGLYVCRACNNPLYNSNSKFRSNCGWPSFDDEIKGAVIRIPDYSLGMKRVEICCSNCKGHLGHVFEGERLTEKNIRHCVNSVSIRFIVK
ncbi:MAG: methionine-R-sulfoxide reductase [Flavobacteriales bacterium]|jgi:peptide-methionine (R)-S-oxide reductase|nr:methionine-R-sulfoxide reductase [Flavobacteriales bacterium]|tara:strand:+ start:447 stop:896 length:450 start_codon:yes stop_codon:yes gene_type:complete